MPLLCSYSLQRFLLLCLLALNFLLNPTYSESLAERQDLIDFWISSGGQQGYWNSWCAWPATLNLNTSFCRGAESAYFGSFQGIRCNAYDGNITRIDRTYCNISGTVPEWRALLSLEWFGVAIGLVRGTLPDSWQYLVNLSHIDVSRNGLVTGTLPAVYGQLRQLNYVSIVWSGVSGPLPPEWGNLTRLQNFLAGSSGIRSTLPPSWGNMVSLQNLDLVGCAITGLLPAEWSGLRSLRSLSFYLSGLQEGSLPPSWGALENLETLGLSNSGIRGPLPSEWSGMRSLRVLDISNNPVGGTLPSSWGMLKNLTTLLLPKGGIVGTIPPEWAGMIQLTYLQLNQNLLTGPLPDAWGSGMLNLDSFYANDNSGINGTLPPSWSSMTKMKVFVVFSTAISGPLPSSWRSWNSIQTLRLCCNRLTGTLPAEWGDFNKISTLHLQENKLFGTLPPEWANMSSLAQLQMQRNLLGGTLPAAWSNMSQITGLALGFNQLEGTLPVSWASMKKMQTLLLPGNQLEGPLPSEWALSMSDIQKTLACQTNCRWDKNVGGWACSSIGALSCVAVQLWYNCLLQEVTVPTAPFQNLSTTPTWNFTNSSFFFLGPQRSNCSTVSISDPVSATTTATPTVFSRNVTWSPSASSSRTNDSSSTVSLSACAASPGLQWSTLAILPTVINAGKPATWWDPEEDLPRPSAVEHLPIRSFKVPFEFVVGQRCLNLTVTGLQFGWTVEPTSAVRLPVQRSLALSSEFDQINVLSANGSSTAFVVSLCTRKSTGFDFSGKKNQREQFLVGLRLRCGSREADSYAQIKVDTPELFSERPLVRMSRVNVASRFLFSRTITLAAPAMQRLVRCGESPEGGMLQLQIGPEVSSSSVAEPKRAALLAGGVLGDVLLGLAIWVVSMAGGVILYVISHHADITNSEILLCAMNEIHGPSLWLPYANMVVVPIVSSAVELLLLHLAGSDAVRFGRQEDVAVSKVISLVGIVVVIGGMYVLARASCQWRAFDALHELTLLPRSSMDLDEPMVHEMFRSARTWHPKSRLAKLFKRRWQLWIGDHECWWYPLLDLLFAAVTGLVGGIASFAQSTAACQAVSVITTLLLMIQLCLLIGRRVIGSVAGFQVQSWIFAVTVLLSLLQLLGVMTVDLTAGSPSLTLQVAIAVFTWILIGMVLVKWCLDVVALLDGLRHLVRNGDTPPPLPPVNDPGMESATPTRSASNDPPRKTVPTVELSSPQDDESSQRSSFSEEEEEKDRSSRNCPPPAEPNEEKCSPRKKWETYEHGMANPLVKWLEQSRAEQHQ